MKDRQSKSTCKGEYAKIPFGRHAVIRANQHQKKGKQNGYQKYKKKHKRASQERKTAKRTNEFTCKS